ATAPPSTATGAGAEARLAPAHRAEHAAPSRDVTAAAAPGIAVSLLPTVVSSSASGEVALPGQTDRRGPGLTLLPGKGVAPGRFLPYNLPPVRGPPRAAIAQLDRATDYGSVGWGFDSSWLHHFSHLEKPVKSRLQNYPEVLIPYTAGC